MSERHKTLELAKRLKAEGDIQADAHIRCMHALIVQMRDALASGADGFAESLLAIAGLPATPAHIESLKRKVQPGTPFGDVLSALAAADNYLGEKA